MQKRNINLDVIRSVAVFSVVGVHFFLNAGYNTTPLINSTMYLSTLIRTGFMICVPLFLLLSGYLMNKKTPSVSYYKGIIKILIVYVLASIPIYLFRVYLGETFTIITLLNSLFRFELYAWYIAMYLGLYFFIPYINIAYNSLQSKKEKTILLGILLTFTALPSLTIIFGYNFIPIFWTGLYPITYYVMGAYIKDFKDDIKLPPLALFGLFLLAVIVGGSLCYVFSFGGPLVNGTWNDWGGFINSITAPLLFLTLLKINFEKMPNVLAKCIETISLVSLPLYLTSYIFDIYVYGYLKMYTYTYEERLVYFPICVLSVFAGSFLLASIITIAQKLITKGTQYIQSKKQ